MSLPDSPDACLRLGTAERVNSAVLCLWAFAQASLSGERQSSSLSFCRGHSSLVLQASAGVTASDRPHPVSLSHTSYRGLNTIHSDIFSWSILFSTLLSDQTVNSRKQGRGAQ